MEIAIIDGCTRTIGESQGYIGLPLRDIVLNDTVNGPGTPAMESAWKASPLELEMLNAGAPVILCVLGKQHPPVMLSIGTPTHPLYPRADVEGIAERIFDLMPFDGPDRTRRPAWIAGGTTARQEEARRYAQAALDVQRQTDLIRPPSPQADVVATFQSRVQPWMMACFGEMIAGDREERNHRFLEEALELVQSTGCTAHEAHQLVDYVYGRAVGEPHQEVGGVMVTLAALCLANDLNMHEAAETELARIWTKVEQIRAKQAAKPKHSPLPGPSAATEGSAG